MEIEQLFQSGLGHRYVRLKDDLTISEAHVSLETFLILNELIRIKNLLKSLAERNKEEGK